MTIVILFNLQHERCQPSKRLTAFLGEMKPLPLSGLIGRLHLMPGALSYALELFLENGNLLVATTLQVHEAVPG